MIYGITLVILGLLAAPSLVLSRKPEAKEWYDKVAPWQGWVGIVFAVIGIVGVLDSLLSVGSHHRPGFYWLTWFAGSLLQACLGFILGYPIIGKFLSHNADAAEKGKQLLEKLLPLQATLGVIAVGIGVWRVITALFY